MNLLAPWRQALRPLIPRGFLRRDQGAALFVSDFPRYGGGPETAARVEAAGFHVTLSEGLAFITPNRAACAALLDGAPICDPAPTDAALFLWSLARRLERDGAPLTPETEEAVWTALKYLDAGDGAGLLRFLAPAAALAKRRHCPLPAGLGRMILCWLEAQTH